jgi:hypothetical protein
MVAYPERAGAIPRSFLVRRATAQVGVSCLGYKAHFSEAVAAMQGKKMNVVAGKALNVYRKRCTG